MANISSIKLPDGKTYDLKDNGALQLTGGQVTGPVTFDDDIDVNTINGVTVGNSPKFTDTVTTVTVTGNGNAVTSGTAANGVVTLTKGTTFLTSHQDISGKADKSTTVTNVAYNSTDKKITKTINGTTTEVVTIATLKTDLGSMPASDVYAWAKASTKPSYSLTEISGTDDLQVIEALTGTSGFLKKTEANTWVLDTNTYLTSYTETDPVFLASPAHEITASDISNWNNKTSNTGTVTKVTAGTGLSIGTTAGGNFTTSGTINHTNSVTAQTTQAIYPIKIDAQGHISAYGDAVTPLTATSTLNAAKLSGAIPSTVTATTQTAGDNSTKIATTAFVSSAISNLPTPMQFIGTVGTNGTVTWTNLPAATGHTGYTYKVITAHDAETGKPAAKIGDTIISTGSEWVVIPSGDEPSGTVTSVAATGATNSGISVSGGPITTSGTLTIDLNLSTAINQLGEGTSSAQRDDYIVAQYAGGGTATTTYHRRKLSNIFAALNQSDITTALGYTPPTTDTNSYHTSGSWNGLTYTATANGGAGVLAFTIQTGSTATTVAVGNHAHGNITNGGDITATAPTIANGDQLIINDHSASKITNGPTFDGSTTTQALTKAGTWGTFLTSHQSLSGYVPTSRKINDHALSSDITLTASDVGALPSDTTIPTIQLVRW